MKICSLCELISLARSGRWKTTILEYWGLWEWRFARWSDSDFLAQSARLGFCFQDQQSMTHKWEFSDCWKQFIWNFISSTNIASSDALIDQKNFTQFLVKRIPFARYWCTFYRSYQLSFRLAYSDPKWRLLSAQFQSNRLSLSSAWESFWHLIRFFITQLLLVQGSYDETISCS
jgi:hypothetical protein